jgi:DNA-binding NarL/FixJ family response regulator
MKPLAAKLAALREKLAARRGGRADYPGGLTEREVEVLRLIAAGKSNREIGEALVISENTVIRHVSNIFSKAGVANRAEAASYAHTHGLAATDPAAPRN